MRTIKKKEMRWSNRGYRATHVRVAGAQSGADPGHSAEDLHSTQAPSVRSQCGVPPAHCASCVHSTHARMVTSHMRFFHGRSQSVSDVHSAQMPRLVSQWLVSGGQGGVPLQRRMHRFVAESHVSFAAQSVAASQGTQRCVEESQRGRVVSVHCVLLVHSTHVDDATSQCNAERPHSVSFAHVGMACACPSESACAASEADELQLPASTRSSKMSSVWHAAIASAKSGATPRFTGRLRGWPPRRGARSRADTARDSRAPPGARGRDAPSRAASYAPRRPSL